MNKMQGLKLCTDLMADPFIDTFNELSGTVNQIANEKGWWKGERNEGETLMLIVTELAEACEWLRHGNGQSNHIPTFLGVEEELADVIIRIMDYSKAKGYRVAGAIIEKIKFNADREKMNGGKKF